MHWLHTYIEQNPKFAPKYLSMTKLLATIVLVFSLQSVFAQESRDVEPVQEVERKDQLMIDFNYENFVNGPSNVDFKWYNRGINVQYLYDIHIVKNRFTIGIGAGFSSQNYYGNGYLTQDTLSNGKVGTVWETRDEDYDRNKVSVNYLEVPLELRYRSKINERGYQWRFTVGAKYGYLIDVHDKLILSNGDKFKTYNFPDVEDYRYGVLTRIGYGKVNLTAYYSVSPFFKDGKGQEMNQLSIGIGITPF